MAFSFQHTIQDSFVLFHLSGRITSEEDARELLDQIDHYTLNSQTNFILDLEQLEYLNSTGLNALIHTLTKSRNAGGDCILTNINEKVEKLFIITKLNTLFTIMGSFEEAKQFYNENLKV